MFQYKFKLISQNYCGNKQKIEDYWQEIKQAYTGRAYHNLSHLTAIYEELEAIKSEVDHYDALFYAICYHDYIYDVNGNDNELQSAELAQQKLAQLNVPKSTIDQVVEHIMATQTHQANSKESAFFVDADLAILGSDNYERYAKAIRQEYADYSDEEFRQGRIKVLQHFLAKEHIYQTPHFYAKYESKARANLHLEMITLTQSVL